MLSVQQRLEKYQAALNQVLKENYNLEGLCTMLRNNPYPIYEFYWRTSKVLPEFGQCLCIHTDQQFKEEPLKFIDLWDYEAQPNDKSFIDRKEWRIAVLNYCIAECKNKLKDQKNNG